jgi:hypothetical protein
MKTQNENDSERTWELEVLSFCVSFSKWYRKNRQKPRICVTVSIPHPHNDVRGENLVTRPPCRTKCRLSRSTLSRRRSAVSSWRRKSAPPVQPPSARRWRFPCGTHHLSRRPAPTCAIFRMTHPRETCGRRHDITTRLLRFCRVNKKKGAHGVAKMVFPAPS